MEILAPYQVTVTVLGMTALMLLVQLLVMDVVGLRNGHTPGQPVSGGHGDMHFRSYRAHANTNESIAIFVLAAAFAMFSGADPYWVNTSAMIYFAGRLAHMLCYYANVGLLRSISFGVSLTGLVGLLLAGFRA